MTVTLITVVAFSMLAVRFASVLAALRLISAVSYGESTAKQISCGKIPADIIESCEGNFIKVSAR